MTKLKWFSIGVVATLVAVLLILVPVQVRIDSSGFLSVGVANTNYSALAADITEIKAYAQMETSGCCIHKGNIQLRFDLFLEPDAPGYDIHYVQVVDTESEEYLKGYQGEVDKETGEPLDWDEYNKWWNSLPLVWRNNPFHCVFIFVDATTTDEYIKQKIDAILEQAYKYWILNIYDMQGAYKVLPLDGLVDEQVLSAKSEQETKLDDLVNRASEFESNGSTQIVLNMGSAGIVSANPDTIDIGAAAIDRAGNSPLCYSGTPHTWVEQSNPADGDGEITSFEIWLTFKTDTIDVWLGTFSASGNVLTCRDSESVGDIAYGSQQTGSGLSITVQSGDYFGASDKIDDSISSYIDRDSSGGTGVWYNAAEYIDPSDSATFISIGSWAISLYGEGETAGCTEDITNSPSSWSVNSGSPVDANSNYSTGLTFFTVTNNSGGAVDIAISGTDMTGGGYTWALSDTATPGDMTYGLYAGLSGGDYTTIVKKNSPFNNLVTGLADSGTQDWGLKIYTPTVYSDGNAKSGTVTVTATCA